MAVIGLVALFILLGAVFFNRNESGSGGPGQSNPKGGQWVSKCRLVQVPNPAYQPAPAGLSISERLAYDGDTRRYVTEQQCTDVYIED